MVRSQKAASSASGALDALDAATQSASSEVVAGFSGFMEAASKRTSKVMERMSGMFSKERSDEEESKESKPKISRVKKAKVKEAGDVGLRQRSKKSLEVSSSPSSEAQGSDPSRILQAPTSQGSARPTREARAAPGLEKQLSLAFQEPINIYPDVSKKSMKSANALKKKASAAGEPTGSERILQSLGAQGVEAFTRALKTGKQRPGCVKLCFVGHARAGKTSTLLALANKDFDFEQASTHGVDTCVLTNELLQISKPQADGEAAWRVAEGSSVRELLSRGVAKGLAEQLRDYQKGQEEGVRASPSSSSQEPTVARPSASASDAQFSDLEQMQAVIKMPLDLVSKAMSQEEPDQVVLQTWDFAGQEMYYSMAHVFITSPGIYVLVVDLSAWLEAVKKPSSMCSCGLPLELSESLDFWLAAVLVHAPDARLIIVGSHDDLVPPELSSKVHGRVNEYLQQRLDPVFHSRLYVNVEDQLLFFPVDNSRSSERSKKGLERLRRVLDQLALEAAEEAGWIPTRWAQFFTVIAEQSKGTRSMRPYVTVEELEASASKFGINDQDLESLLRLFHGLGQLLHFPNSPAVVLEPQWLLDAMAQVVACPRVLQRNSHHAACLLQKGELREELLLELWRDERFRGQEVILRAFLEHFGLLVPIASGEVKQWLVPSLLPKRGYKEIQRPPEVNQASLYFDFHGALRQLLPSLLPRLLKQLSSAVPKVLCQDFLAFSLGVSFVTLELIHLEPREALKLTVSAEDLNQTLMCRVFGLVSEGLSAAVPKLSFSTKVPCPKCGGAEPRHLLDLSDVLGEQQLFCSVAQEVFSERCLPAYLREWRCSERRGQNQAADAERDGEAIFQLDFLYASPILWSGATLTKLDIMSELQALMGIPGISPRVEVANMETLQDALLRRRELPTVMHLSAHIGTVGGKPQLLLEDQRGVAHALNEEALSAMAWEADVADHGSWLLVFLACGSEQVVEHLIRTAGLRHAICCSGEILDASARVFCRAFYKALAAGKSISESHGMAQSSVQHSANLGIREEAGKFLYLVRPDHEPEQGLTSKMQARRAATWATWPSWPRVEDYASCRLIDSCKIANAFRERRVVLVLGEQGIGKSSMCREFGGYFSAPGRFFADRIYLLEASASRASPVAMLMSKLCPGQSGAELAEMPEVRALDAKPWLLVVDGLSEMPHCEEMIQTLDRLLSRTSGMKLLLTSRYRLPLQASGGGFSGFQAAKAVELRVSPLPPSFAAELFLRRANRPLYPGDFDKTARVAQPLHYEPSILERLAASPLLHALGGVPGRIADAAALVNDSLPSLLQHPALPVEWSVGESDTLELEPL